MLKLFRFRQNRSKAGNKSSFLTVELFIHLLIYFYEACQSMSKNNDSSLKTMTKVTVSTFLDQFSVFYYVCKIEINIMK